MNTTTPAPAKNRRTKLLDSRLELDQIDAQYRKQAACVLEVLAGLRTPEQAAITLGVSLPTYYNLETRALRGLVHGCMPQPHGRTMTLSRKLEGAQQRCRELERQLQRHQALLRSAHRSIGLLAPPDPKPRPNARRKAKRPAIRALRVIQSLHCDAELPPVQAAAPVPVENQADSIVV